MKKRLIGGLILFLMIVFFTWLAWNKNPYMRSVVVQTAVVYSQEEYISRQTQDAYLNKEYYKRPFDFNSYDRDGYYQFDPQTILPSLENEDVNVFEPLLTNPSEVKKITGASISWTQADYLRVFSVNWSGMILWTPKFGRFFMSILWATVLTRLVIFVMH